MEKEYNLAPHKCLYCYYIKSKLKTYEIGICKYNNTEVDLTKENECEKFNPFVKMKDNERKRDKKRTVEVSPI